ncbi:hypothetical protein BpHYR1_009317 [Brachionus plicatilis]|uniref:Uncharacterized protein n=1 Tax=Brachionus plicatilis TaxID=10195 RepID=A0A3M7SZS1_BRAPC|nr:hypothetical protein BpHYR1_009317 [Brachionus plicatilis]
MAYEKSTYLESKRDKNGIVGRKEFKFYHQIAANDRHQYVINKEVNTRKASCDFFSNFCAKIGVINRSNLRQSNLFLDILRNLRFLRTKNILNLGPEFEIIFFLNNKIFISQIIVTFKKQLMIDASRPKYKNVQNLEFFLIHFLEFEILEKYLSTQFLTKFL